MKESIKVAVWRDVTLLKEPGLKKLITIQKKVVTKESEWSQS